MMAQRELFGLFDQLDRLSKDGDPLELLECQSALKFDPVSAFKIDPFVSSGRSFSFDLNDEEACCCC